MFFTLFGQECRQILKSLVFYLFVIVFILFLTSQMSGNTDKMEPPQPGQEFYGTGYSRDETTIMERTLAELALDTYHKAFDTYPLGFLKRVNLNDQELAQIEGYLEECTGKTLDRILQEDLADYFNQNRSGNLEFSMSAQYSYRVQVKEDLTYSRFLEILEEVCRIIGRGSKYEPSQMENGVRVPQTYEEALTAYQDMLEKDRLTGAYARLFCDYAGIVLALLPIFMGVTRVLKDKRSKAADVIYAKKASSGVIVWSRFLANTVLILLTVLAAALFMQSPYLYQAQTMGVSVDMFAFVKYTVLWLLPEVMAVLAFSFLITELTGGILSIFLQAGWAYYSLMSARTLVGSFGLQLIARWNTVGSTALFESQKSQLYLNRGFYLFLSLAAVALTVLVYELKRRRGFSLSLRARRPETGKEG